MAPTNPRRPESATDVPNRSVGSASAGTNFAVWRHSPASSRPNRYADPGVLAVRVLVVFGADERAVAPQRHVAPEHVRPVPVGRGEPRLRDPVAVDPLERVGRPAVEPGGVVVPPRAEQRRRPVQRDGTADVVLVVAAVAHRRRQRRPLAPLVARPDEHEPRPGAVAARRPDHRGVAVECDRRPASAPSPAPSGTSRAVSVHSPAERSVPTEPSGVPSPAPRAERTRRSRPASRRRLRPRARRR